MPILFIALAIAWAYWERLRRLEVEHQHRDLEDVVRRYVGDVLKEQGRDPIQVADFCHKTEPATQLFLLSPDGERECYRLPPRRPQKENGSFSDRSS